MRRTAATLQRWTSFPKSKGLWLTIRFLGYLEKKAELEKPRALLSHDSREKAEVAGPVAVGLQKLMCPMWYDEFSLKVGDYLRESIERGLKEGLSPIHRCCSPHRAKEYPRHSTSADSQKGRIMPSLRHCRHLWFPPFAENAKNGAPRCIGRVGEIKSRATPSSVTEAKPNAKTQSPDLDP